MKKSQMLRVIVFIVLLPSLAWARGIGIYVYNEVGSLMLLANFIAYGFLFVAIPVLITEENKKHLKTLAATVSIIAFLLIIGYAYSLHLGFQETHPIRDIGEDVDTYIKLAKSNAGDAIYANVVMMLAGLIFRFKFSRDVRK